MKQKRKRRQTKKVGLTIGQMVLLFLFVVAMALAAAVVVGYTLGVFDSLLPTGQPDDPDTEISGTRDITSSPDESVSNTPSALEPQESNSTMLPNSPTRTSTGSTSLSTPATVTPTATITPTPPADLCALLDLRFLNATSNIAVWRLQNTSGEEMAITRIEISWPKSNDAIFNAFLDGDVIWSMEDLVSPTFMTQWVSDLESRVIGSMSRLEFFFGTAAAATGYDLAVSFDNGCEVTHSN